MSASASKKKRKELEGLGLSPKDMTSKKTHQQKSKALRTTLVVLLAIIVCAAAVFAVIKLVNRPSYDTKAAVMTVGSEQISVPVYNYLYNLTAQNVYSTYSYFFQAGTPFAEQSSIFGEGTMEDFFKKTTNDSVKEILNVVAEAKANHYDLPEEDKASVASGVSAVKSEASTYGYSSPDKYLAARFGEGCNLENYEEYLNLVMLYSSYAQKLNEDYAPTAEQLEEAYQADPSNYDLVSFTYTSVNTESTTVEPAEDSSDPTAESQAAEIVYTDEAKAAARQTAEDYTKQMPESATTKTYNKSDVSSYLTEEIAAWLFDAARKEGDVSVFARDENETLFYAVRYESRDTNDYQLVKANIFTIEKDQPEEEQEVATAEQKEEALQEELQDGTTEAETEPAEEVKTAEQKHEELLAAIHDGMSDEDFNAAVSAQGYSVNSGSYSKTYSIEEIRDFLFDPSRQAGDLYTAYETDTAYYVVRFVSLEEDSYRNQLVKADLRTEYYNGIASKNELQIDENMMRYANTNLVFGSSES